VRDACGGGFHRLTPGIRPSGGAVQDQARVVSPAQALRDGSTWLVVGRPITRADDPAAAADAILAEMEEA
jgi:orotidine-5'-phosphate decarboxylase